MRNFRALILLLEHLERDALGKNSARGLGSSVCLHVNHFFQCRELKEISSQLSSLLPSSDIKFGSSSYHCPSVTIAKLSHLPVDDFVRRKSFSEKPPISN